MQIFKKGDLVSVKYCEELTMPCTIEGFDPWCKYVDKPDGSKVYFYKVVGKHAKRGNMVSVTVSESQLHNWE